jgi:saccharopine dehydrogenase-like NADP-dependent oxidoreductase
MTTKLILLGGGKIGSAISAMLGSTGDYQLTVADRDAESLKRLPSKNVKTQVLDVADPAALKAAIKGHDVVVSAMPYHLTPVIAGAAKDMGAHYFDLTEDVESTRVVKQLAKGADTAFVPQCGLAPGECAEIQSDLVDGRPHQRVLQSVRGDRRRHVARGSGAGRDGAFLARRRRL